MKKRRLNNNGFSMIELLAAVTILGILSVLAIGAVQRLLDKSEEEFYSEQENGLIMAAESYYQGNSNKLPKSIGQTEKVPLETLVNSKYIDEIKTKSKKNCNKATSYVEIIKYTQKDYKYVVYLDCGDEYKTPAPSAKEAPTVEISMPNTENEVKDIIITANLKGDGKETVEKKLLSYNYVVYAAPIGTTNFKEVKNSGSVGIRSKEKTVNINVDEYLPAEIKVEVTAINIDGRKKTVKEGPKTYKDTIAPLCQDPAPGEKKWQNIASKTITMICNQENEAEQKGSGCARPYYTKVFTAEAGVDYMEIKDKAGNSVQCPANVYIDRTKPSLTITNSSNGKWTNQNVKIEAIASDAGSGIEKIEYSHNGVDWSTSNWDASSTLSKTTGTWKSERNNNFYVKATDKAGNYTIATTSIKIDKTAPTLTIKAYNRKSDKSNGTLIAEKTAKSGSETATLAPTSWFNSSVSGVNITVAASDSSSGIKSGTLYWNAGGTTKFVDSPTWSDGGPRNIADGSDSSYFTADGYRQANYTLVDSAGNTSIIKMKFKIDKTAPATPSSLSNSSGGSCTTKNIDISAKSSDAISGIKKWQYKFGDGSWNDRDDTTTFSITLTSNRTATMYIRAVDNAGNNSSNVTTTIQKKDQCYSKKCGYYGYKREVQYYTNCHCGAAKHTQGYPHFCIENDGDICVRYNNGSLSKYPVCKDRSPSFTFYCPNNDPKDLGGTYLSGY